LADRFLLISAKMHDFASILNDYVVPNLIINRAFSEEIILTVTKRSIKRREGLFAPHRMLRGGESDSGESGDWW
jgi:hypothetical protein